MPLVLTFQAIKISNFDKFSLFTVKALGARLDDVFHDGTENNVRT